MRQVETFAVYWSISLALLPPLALAQDCSWCGMPDAPETLSWSTVIAAADEPGERLVVTGTVYEEGGDAPAAGARVYVYHTNSKGVYPKRGSERGNASRHGYLHGWMQTDEAGRYRFETIRPAPYRTHGGEPAHIHYTVQPRGGEEYWLNAAWFSDDPRVTDELVSNLERQGGFSNVMDISRDEAGVWRGRRDIIIDSYD